MSVRHTKWNLPNECLSEAGAWGGGEQEGWRPPSGAEGLRAKGVSGTPSCSKRSPCGTEGGPGM